MTRITAAITLALFLFTACKNTPCSNQYITPAFIGFTTADIDTVIVRKYKKNDNFLHLLDTALFTNNPSVAYYATSHDTTMVVLNVISGEEKYIFPDNDWQVYIPGANTTIALSDIVSPQTDYKCVGDHCGCTNPIISFQQNGQLIIPQFTALPAPFSYVTGYIAYIHR